MSTAKQSDFITEQSYLDSELLSEVKREYLDGQVYSMAGTSKNHDIIATNLARQFGNHLQDSPCQFYGPDLRIKTSTKSYRYSDGMVVCEDSGDAFRNKSTTESPVIIVEVLSKNTRHMDKGVKLLEYINIPPMKEYVMIEQDFVSIDVLRRSEGWILRNYTLGDPIYFESIELALSVEEIYHRVKNDDIVQFLKA